VCGWLFVEGAYGAAVAVSADDDVMDSKVEHGELDRCDCAVVAERSVIRWDQVADVAHDKQFTTPAVGEEAGDDSGIGAAGKERGGMLALGHELAVLPLVGGKYLSWKRFRRPSSSSGIGLLMTGAHNPPLLSSRSFTHRLAY
jgi:hypothetical protein